MKTNTNLVYTGEVQLSIKKGNKITKIKKKNSGLPMMFKFFAKALSNNLQNDDYPERIDLRRSLDYQNDEPDGSILKTTIGISGRTYKYLNGEWKCVLNAQIGFDDLRYSTSNNNYYYRLYLFNNSEDGDYVDDVAMAYLDLNVSDDGTVMPGGLDMLSQGSQLLIEWYLGISNPIVQENGSVSENE